MKARFPLMAKMLVWLLVHLVVLATAFVLFISWQLRLGFDSILSEAAGERLTVLGESLVEELRESPESEWPKIVERQVKPYGVQASLRMNDGEWRVGTGDGVPKAIDQKLAEMLPRPPPRARPGRRMNRPEAAPKRGGADLPPPLRSENRGPGPELRRDRRPELEVRVRPIFLEREAGVYWAAIDLPLFVPGSQSPRHGVLLLRSDDIRAGGLFFDLGPWLMGGLAVLILSLLLWAPFVLGITRFVSRLSRTTEMIAEGDFDAQVGASRRDELGVLGDSIEAMAGRLDRLVRGQKRFLGDVAHELCSPLARLRTGLGILEQGIDGKLRGRLESIEEDAAELSELISEVLAFTKASTAPDAVKLEEIELWPLVEQAIERECPEHKVNLVIPMGLKVHADQSLLGRCFANLLRNSHRHAGSSCHITLSAKIRREKVEIMLKDDGPGVAKKELELLFEPFYRPDSARTREAGGSGLGLAMVKSGIEACGGSVSARAGNPNGLVILMTLKGTRPGGHPSFTRAQDV